MTDWQSIDTAPTYFRGRGLEMLLGRSGRINTWGEVFIWVPKDADREAGFHRAVYIEWEDDPKNTHWRIVGRDDEIKPTHWRLLFEPPQ
jgi:hypothetical protein